MSKEMKLSF